MDEDIKQVLCRHRENLEKTVSSLKMKLARSAEEHDKVYVKLMKVNQSVSPAPMMDPSVFALHRSKSSPNVGVSAGERDADYRDQ